MPEFGAENIKCPFPGFSPSSCSFEGSRAISKPRPYPDTHQTPVETLSNKRGVFRGLGGGGWGRGLAQCHWGRWQIYENLGFPISKPGVSQSPIVGRPAAQEGKDTNVVDCQQNDLSCGDQLALRRRALSPDGHGW